MLSFILWAVGPSCDWGGITVFLEHQITGSVQNMSGCVSYAPLIVSSFKYSFYLAEVTTTVAVHVVHIVSIHFTACLKIFPFIHQSLISDIKQVLSNCSLCCVN